jgi:hypothetical protein
MAVWVCAAAHNLEEGLTAEAYLPEVKALLGGRTPASMAALVPGLQQFYIALIGATLIPLIMTAVATTGRPTPLKKYLSPLLAVTLLLNVFIPHVPAAIALGGYAPGVATAVLVNLPFSTFFLKRSMNEGVISRRGVVTLAGIGLLILGLVVPVVWLLTANT